MPPELTDTASPVSLPTADQLAALFDQKYGQANPMPRRRRRFGYYTPADVYEALVSRLVTPDCTWLDVGGGHRIFPENPDLSRTLADRSAKVVAVDPSENVQRNPYVHERVQCVLEDFQPTDRFDLVTMRMVVEHVSAPQPFMDTLSRVIKPGGLAVVFTVNRYAPITLLSRVMPFDLHHPIKRLFWGGEAEDTFPVQYRMNSRRSLGRLFTTAGFDEACFARLDDLSTFGQFNWLNLIELLAWRTFNGLGLTYPENCLLGVYRKR